MALRRIRLELARNAAHPEGSAAHGYAFVAPLTDDGHLDLEEWRESLSDCTVRRFWAGEDDEHGHLVHHRGADWAFRYVGMSEDDEEPIFRFDRHRFAVGEYVSITEHDGVQLPSGSPRWCLSRHSAGPASDDHARKAPSMSIRIILTPLFGDDADAAAAHAAFAVTRRFDAHVEGLFARIDPLDTVPIVGEGVSPVVIDDLTNAAQAEMDKRASAAKAHFEAARTAAGVELAERPPGPGGTSARWTEITGRREEVIPQRARVSDLVVFGAQPSDSPELGGAIETTLVAGGRPLLLAPKGVQTIGERVAIAWNDSAEAARALASALPFVEAASAVHVLTAETWRTRFEVTEHLADYLEWRGIVCERRSIAAEDESVGAALLGAASEAGADLLVMGGYGRSRLRELVLGGATRHILTHAQLPVLLAH